MWNKANRLIWYCQRGGVIGGGLVVVFVMVLMFTDVICRYIFNSPLTGVMELTKAVLLPSIVFLAVAGTDHVSVRVIVEHVHGKVGQILQQCSLLVTIGLIGVITWKSTQKAAFSVSILELAPESALPIPVYPSRILVAAGFFLFFWVLILRFVNNMTKGSGATE